MRAVIQRVVRAEVLVNDKVVGSISGGLLIFLGVESADTNKDVLWLAEKIPAIRCFEDDAGKMNRSLRDIEGGALVISQFTLYGSLRKGTRPSFNRAADPATAIPLYETFVRNLELNLGQPVATGEFGAMMKINALNDGPVTLVIDTRNRDF